MKKIKPYVVIFNPITQQQAISNVIIGLRNCYRSFDMSSPESDVALVVKARDLKHTSIFEQWSGIKLAECMNRGVHNENVRQRIGVSRAAESTRWVDYAKEKHGGEISIIDTVFFQDSPEAYAVWEAAMEAAEKAYFKLRELGYPQQAAREVLPLSLKISEVQEYNCTSLRYRFMQRCPNNVHPEFRRITLPLLEWFATRYPLFFGDLYEEFQPYYNDYIAKYGRESFAEIVVLEGDITSKDLLKYL